MAQINHANRFFKEIKRLEDALDVQRRTADDPCDEFGHTVWACFSHESAPENCFVRDDGLWESYPEQYGRKTRKFIFIWRYQPNYCTRGRPFYSHEQRQAFVDESETEKVLYTYKDLELVWGWNEIFGPTSICWGMKPGEKYFFARDKGEIVVPPMRVKKYFNEAVKQLEIT